MDTETSRAISRILSLGAQVDADPVQVAGIIVDLWANIDGALSPVIGHKGFCALYLHSLQSTARDHPWLATANPAAMDVDFAALKDALARESSGRSAAAGAAVLRTFCELLASLIGTSLTERLLRSVWETSSGTQLGKIPPNDQ